MRACTALLLLLVSLTAVAVIETYQFESDVLQKRYQTFTQELRCPKCQNQNLSGSNSPIAEDLRRELYRLLHEGYSDQQIIDFMVARYGEFVLYRPPVNKKTLILWLAPAILLLLSAVAVVLVLRKQAPKKQGAAAAESLSESEQQKLNTILKGRDHD